MENTDRTSLRKVMVRRSANYSNNSPRKGYFHGWGNITETDANNNPYFVEKGFVEIESGEVWSCDPWNIKFVENFGEEPV